MNKPVDVKVSVDLAVYNGELYLKDAIDSILFQSFKDFEFIIVNDGSTDSTAEIISTYDDSRIVYLENEVNKGLIYSLNLGLSISKGKYIARMDSDDIALPLRLQVQYDFMESHPEIGLCGSIVEAFYEGTQKKLVVQFPEDDKAIRVYAYFQSPFCHPTVMFRKEIITKNNLEYPKGFHCAEDYALWIEMLKYTQTYNIQIVLLHYRKHEGSETWLSGAKPGRNDLITNTIQHIYFQQNGIAMAFEDIFPFACFVNRSGGYSLTKENQWKLDRILKDFFSQLFQKQQASVSLAKEYVSTACFYHFVKNKKFPLAPYLWKLYFHGFFIFLKKIPTFARRKINNNIRKKNV
jgi:glycosyltransferase involved in cell wall biosynthesis